MKKAVIFGASGFIGSYLLEELLDDPRYEQVIAVVRKGLGASHPKLRQVTGTYETIDEWGQQIVADDVFICLGTTRKKTPNEADYYKIDHDYPVAAAKMARRHGAKAVLLVSAVGADANSRMFYVRTKGETERDIIALGFESTHIFRPSMLLGTREEKRPLERLFIRLWPAINPLFFGNMSKYRGIEGKELAKAMLAAAKNQARKLAIYHWQEMQER